MDYLKEYRSFTSSLYLGEGIRKTVGILLPVLLLGHYGMLLTGMAISLGALFVSITDNPGPILHRINGQLICNILIFIISLIMGFINHINWLFALLLPFLCFFFSMIGVYGTRATSVGIAVLLVIIIETQNRYSGWQVVYNSLYLFAGGCWYFVLSLTLYSIRPYKLVQQSLGEYVLSTADYLRAKATLYNDTIDYDKSNSLLVSKQIAVQGKQNLVTELIFKTRSIVEESTHTGRVLMMAFLDVSDLFEKTMSSHQDYEKLHQYFSETGILTEYKQLILSLATELDAIGIALQSGRKSVYNEHIDTVLLKEREHLQDLRLHLMSAANVDIFISLKQILDTIDDIATRIRTLHQYTTYDRKLRKKKIQPVDPEDFISHQEIDPKVLWNNLSFRSNIFRHSLRIALAAVTAFLIGLLLPVGHSYWILLTVIVILKPGYSLTKKRNYQRLTGTLMGAAICAVFLYLVKDKTAILVVLAVSMIGAYSFVRTHYFTGVVLITIYVLLMFHLLDAKDFKTVLSDRLIDTISGSVLAFVCSYLFSPVWEQENIHLFMSKMLRHNLQYYQVIAGVFVGKNVTKTDIRITRKDSLVSLANLSDAFNRMLSEPKSKQKNIEQVHQFVVSNHMLTSHIATLAYYADPIQPDYVMDEYQPLIILTKTYLEQSVQLIERGEKKAPEEAIIEDSQVRLLDQRINTLMHIRQEELKQGKIESETRKILSQFKSITDQFYFIYKVSADIEKISEKLKAVV
jgi:uncharacterized membrane protein (TIGR01666 family)